MLENKSGKKKFSFTGMVFIEIRQNYISNHNKIKNSDFSKKKQGSDSGQV